MTRSVRRLPITVVCFAAALNLAAPAHADTDTDSHYFHALDKTGVWYDTPAHAIDMGHGVCMALQADVPVSKILRATVAGGYTYAQAGSIVGIATGAYCPQYEDIVIAQEKQQLADVSGG